MPANIGAKKEVIAKPEKKPTLTQTIKKTELQPPKKEVKPQPEVKPPQQQNQPPTMHNPYMQQQTMREQPPIKETPNPLASKPKESKPPGYKPLPALGFSKGTGLLGIKNDGKPGNAEDADIFVSYKAGHQEDEDHELISRVNARRDRMMHNLSNNLK